MIVTIIARVTRLDCSTESSVPVRVCCAQVIDEEGLQQNSLDVGTYFLDKLSGMRREWKIIGDVRGKGLMVGVELVDGDQDEKDAAVPALNSRAVSRIINDCRKMGLLIGVGGVRSNVSILRYRHGIMVTE